MWITACHALWNWRNLEVHDDQYERPFDMVRHILRRVQDSKQAMDTVKKVNSVENVKVYIGLKPPIENMMKLNTDGARNISCEAGCKGIIRDQKGDWKGGFVKYVGNCSVVLAEF